MRRLLSLFLLVLSLAAPLASAATDAYRQLAWEALVPKDWDPLKEFKSLNLGAMPDSDPRAMDALNRMRDMWNNAPTEHTLNGARVRMTGFAIPLEIKGEKMTEFLLVPYFGACIHSPPPPANQIVHAISKKPLASVRSMDAVTVSGTMSLNRADSPWGASGYRLTVDSVEPYKIEEKK